MVRSLIDPGAISRDRSGRKHAARAVSALLDILPGTKFPLLRDVSDLTVRTV
jgi:hypothetical protein